MATQKEIKTKINGIKNIQKISRAMKLVATAKLKQAVTKMNSTRPYLEGLRHLLLHLACRDGVTVPDHPYFRPPRDRKKASVMVIAGDRGLCGSFNSEILRRAEGLLEELRRDRLGIEIYAVGKKCLDYFSRSGLYPIAGSLLNFGKKPDLKRIHQLVTELTDRFEGGQLSEVYIVYAHFISNLSYQPRVDRLLPTSLDRIREEEGGIEASHCCRVEPDPASLLESLLPRYVDMAIFQDILEALSCEHAARMVAMSSASDKAAEILQDLTLEYNRVRQGTITRQIIEIVSGAEALEN